LYINDICEVVESNIKLYADDTMLYREIKCGQDSAKLQNDLDSINNWCKQWQLQLNVEKCCIMHASRSMKPLIQNYSLSGEPLKVVQQYKYLGLQITPKLTWGNQIHKITGAANARLRFVQNVLKGCPSKVKSVAYFSLVRPLLEYCSAIWDPHQAGLIREIEMVQRRAARFVSCKFGRTDSVTDMLSTLGWESLEDRRKEINVRLLGRILRGECDVNIENIVCSAPVRSRRRGHTKMVTEFQCRCDSYLNSYFPRVCRQWNNLTETQVQSLLKEGQPRVCP